MNTLAIIICFFCWICHAVAMERRLDRIADELRRARTGE